MKLLIAGSRTLSPTADDIDRALEQLRAEHEITATIELVISGTARGVDQAGEAWAKARGIPIERMPADWSTHGKRAGHIRNAAMAEIATHALVWWDGVSKGTRDMMRILEDREILHIATQLDPEGP